MHLLWRDVNVNEGDLLKLTCPVDTRNSCLIDFVEWLSTLLATKWQLFPHRYYNPTSGESSGRRLVRDGIAPNDPLILYASSASKEQEGWYTCVVGNYAGRAEQTVRVKVG